MAHGFASVSTRQICAAAGVKQPSLYHHFGSKEELYLAVIEHWFAKLRLQIEQAAELPDLLEKLHAVARIFWSGSVGEYQAMQRDAMHHMPQEHRRQVGLAVYAAVIAPLVRILSQAIAAGELPAHANPFVLTQIYWGMVDGFSFIYYRGDPMPPPDRAGAIIDFFLHGARQMTSADYATWPQSNPGAQLFEPPLRDGSA